MVKQSTKSLLLTVLAVVMSISLAFGIFSFSTQSASAATTYTAANGDNSSEIVYDFVNTIKANTLSTNTYKQHASYPKTGDATFGLFNNGTGNMGNDSNKGLKLSNSTSAGCAIQFYAIPGTVMKITLNAENGAPLTLRKSSTQTDLTTDNYNSDTMGTVAETYAGTGKVQTLVYDNSNDSASFYTLSSSKLIYLNSIVFTPKSLYISNPYTWKAPFGNAENFSFSTGCLATQTTTSTVNNETIRYMKPDSNARTLTVSNLDSTKTYNVTAYVHSTKANDARTLTIDGSGTLLDSGDNTVTKKGVTGKESFTIVMNGDGVYWGKVIVEEAQTTPKYTVTYDNGYNDNDVVDADKEAGSYTLAGAPSRAGYTFTGWSDGTTTYQAGTTYTLGGNVTFTAQWELNEYTVTLNFDDGVTADQKLTWTVEDETIPTLPDLTGTRDDYTFLGWYLDGVIVEEITTELNGETLVADWQEIKEEYDVIFYSNGDLWLEDVVKANTAYGAPADPTLDGYRFDGWYLEGKDTAYDFSTLVNQDLELIAKWVAIEYTVTLNYDDGATANETLTWTVETGAPELEDATRAHYNFLGWFIGDNEVLALSTKLNGETLTAKWEEMAKYTVSFNSNGGSTVEAKTWYEDQSIPALPTATRDGYALVGWFNGSEQVSALTENLNGATLVAKWVRSTSEDIIADNFTVGEAFDYSSSGITISITGATVTKLNNPAKSSDNQTFNNVFLPSAQSTSFDEANRHFKITVLRNVKSLTVYYSATDGKQENKETSFIYKIGENDAETESGIEKITTAYFHTFTNIESGTTILIRSAGQRLAVFGFKIEYAVTPIEITLNGETVSTYAGNTFADLDYTPATVDGYDYLGVLDSNYNVITDTTELVANAEYTAIYGKTSVVQGASILLSTDSTQVGIRFEGQFEVYNKGFAASKVIRAFNKSFKLTISLEEGGAYTREFLAKEFSEDILTSTIKFTISIKGEATVEGVSLAERKITASVEGGNSYVTTAQEKAQQYLDQNGDALMAKVGGAEKIAALETAYGCKYNPSANN